MNGQSVRWKRSAISPPTAALAVAVAILVGLLVLVASTPRSPTSPVTLTSTTTMTSTETVENGFTASSAESEAIVLGNSTVSSVSADGIQLATSINATSLTSGEGLRVTLSISNTLPTMNLVNASNDWAFQGVPVALWNACYLSVPAEVAVLNGNYSANELPLVAGAAFHYYCMEGGTVDRMIFQPDSDNATLTGESCFGSCTNATIGTYALTLNFTTHGYWDLPYLATVSPPAGIPGQPYSLPFLPGVYTVAVADEWGQVNVLHFQFVAKGYAPSVVLESFSLCTSNCYYPAPFLTGTVYFNSTAPVRNFDLSVNGTIQNGGPGPLGEGYAIAATNVPFVFKETLMSPVVAGDHYVISLEFYFDDNTSATAITNVVAQ